MIKSMLDWMCHEIKAIEVTYYDGLQYYPPVIRFQVGNIPACS